MADVAVLVPVLQRPQNAAPLMASLLASTDDAAAYAVCDADDTASIAAWEQASATVVTFPARQGRPGTFAEKVNLGYRSTDEPWLFLTGDDVRFHRGWLDCARIVASTVYDVVGTNDLGNPRVLAGQHATHLLVRRSYVDRVGASWDGPGVLAHEGYRHMFVDDEIVTAAKQRGVWAMALSSRVEHLHPLYGTADMDSVYALGQTSMQRDRQLFLRRLGVPTSEPVG